MSDVERVLPIDGARRVSFDHDAADAALTAVRTQFGIVGEQVPGRTAAADAARTDWSGHFRDEFDRAEENLQHRFSTTAGYGPLGPTSEILAAVRRANDRQRQYNAERLAEIQAEQEAAQAAS